MQKIKDIIKKLDLIPHPEGGYYKQTYKSSRNIPCESLGPHYNSERPYSTCIYFLLTSDNFSAFHRIKQDEIWHFYDGSPIRLHVISNDGEYKNFLIGNNVMDGEVPQLAVTGGSWFAAELIVNNSYALTGCTVSPGFDFNDFELMSRKEACNCYPEHKALIERLTRKD